MTEEEQMPTPLEQLEKQLSWANQRITQLEGAVKTTAALVAGAADYERRKVAEEILDLHRCFEGARNQHEFETTVRRRYIQGTT